MRKPTFVMLGEVAVNPDTVEWVSSLGINVNDVEESMLTFVSGAGLRIPNMTVADVVAALSQNVTEE